MNLPKEAENKLKNNLKFCYNEEFIVTNEDSKWFNESLGVEDLNSSFISYYTVVAFPPVGNGSELLTLESIIENIEYDKKELPNGIGTRFIRITSFEGEGAYYYDNQTDKLYDTDWGNEEDMIKGRHQALAESFYDFLKKYYEKT